MQLLTIQAASPASAAALHNVLSVFQPELETDDEGRSSVSVVLGSDRQVVAVLDRIHEHLRSRPDGEAVSTLVVALDDREATGVT